MVYIDTNMVRAGVVSHPSEWGFCGYREIQEPRKKNVLIDYERIQRLFGASSYDQLRDSHRGRVEEYLGEGAKGREDPWTSSIAVGSRSFVEALKSFLGLRAKGREAIGAGEGYQLREGAAHYNTLFTAEKGDIAAENTCFWETKVR